MIKTGVLLWLATLACICAVSCTPSANLFFRPATIGTNDPQLSCPSQPSHVQEKWIRRRGRRLPFTMLVSSEVTYLRALHRRNGIVEAWSDNTDLQITASVTESFKQPLYNAYDDEQVLHCRMVLSGTEADVFTFFSERTTVPGQYVVAVWKGTNGTAFVLRLNARSRSRLGEMLRIVASVEFTSRAR